MQPSYPRCLWVLLFCSRQGIFVGSFSKWFHSILTVRRPLVIEFHLPEPLWRPCSVGPKTHLDPFSSWIQIQIHCHADCNFKDQIGFLWGVSLAMKRPSALKRPASTHELPTVKRPATRRHRLTHQGGWVWSHVYTIIYQSVTFQNMLNDIMYTHYIYICIYIYIAFISAFNM